MYVFADTVYWSALFSPQDDLHARAERLTESLAGVLIVTSDLVLIEFLNGFAGRGRRSRALASSSVQVLRRGTNAIVESLTPESFDAALKLYRERPDKGWSITDCSSFLIMQRFGIDSALTYDKHFEQAGFTALLR